MTTKKAKPRKSADLVAVGDQMSKLKVVGGTDIVVPLKEVLWDVAFPPIDPGMEPFGSRVLVQLRMPKDRAGKLGLIHMPDEAIDTEKWHTQVGRVRALGPVAFRARSDMKEWPESAWCRVGDFVRVPKYNGDRIEVPFEIATEKGVAKGVTLFAIFNDLELIGKVTGDPLAIVAYV